MIERPPRFRENEMGKYKRAADVSPGEFVYVQPAHQYNPDATDNGFKDIYHMGVRVVRVEPTKQEGNPKVIVKAWNGKEFALGSGTSTQAEGPNGYDWPKIRTENRLARERRKRGNISPLT